MLIVVVVNEPGGNVLHRLYKGAHMAGCRIEDIDALI